MPRSFYQTQAPWSHLTSLYHFRRLRQSRHRAAVAAATAQSLLPHRAGATSVTPTMSSHPSDPPRPACIVRLWGMERGQDSRGPKAPTVPCLSAMLLVAEHLVRAPRRASVEHSLDESLAFLERDLLAVLTNDDRHRRGREVAEFRHHQLSTRHVSIKLGYDLPAAGSAAAPPCQHARRHWHCMSAFLHAASPPRLGAVFGCAALRDAAGGGMVGVP